MGVLCGERVTQAFLSGLRVLRGSEVPLSVRPLERSVLSVILGLRSL